MRPLNCCIALSLSILFLASICSAQQAASDAPTNSEREGSTTPPPGPVIGGMGTTNYIPIWAAPTFLLSSVIYQNGSSIGIDTTTPAATLDVNGGVNTAQTYGVGGNAVLSIGSLADRNLFLGVGAGAENVVGEGRQNVFSGYEAGASNTIGSFNVFSGSYAGFSNSTGYDNTFSGAEAGYSNSTGYNNVFSGSVAGQLNTTGHDNIFYGVEAGGSNTTGIGNTFSGSYAGQLSTIGSYNTFLGLAAGENNTTGSNDLYIANFGPRSGTESNTIRIGTQGTGDGQQIAAYIAGVYGSTVGGNGIAVYVDNNGQLGTTVSSLRFKEQVRDMGDSTDALMKLRPVTFLYKPEYDKGTRSLQYGLIAEEVAKVYPELVANDSDGQPYTVRYQYIAIMLLNEVQKQYHRAEQEAEIIKAQEWKVDDLERRLSRLEKMVSNQGRTVAQK